MGKIGRTGEETHERPRKDSTREADPDYDAQEATKGKEALEHQNKFPMF